MSIKWMVIFLALFVLVSIGAGFIKGAIQQRKINKEAAKKKIKYNPNTNWF